jgi:hypothetical protein
MAPRNPQISQKYEQASEETEKIDLANVIPWSHDGGVDIITIVQNDINQTLEPSTPTNDFRASARSTPPVISMSDWGAAARMAWLGVMIWPIRGDKSSIEAAKTTRLTPHQTRAPIHIGQGSPVV